MHAPPARVLMPTLETIEPGSLESDEVPAETRTANQRECKWNVSETRQADQIVPSNNIMEEAGISEF